MESWHCGRDSFLKAACCSRGRLCAISTHNHFTKESSNNAIYVSNSFCKVMHYRLHKDTSTTQIQSNSLRYASAELQSQSNHLVSTEVFYSFYSWLLRTGPSCLLRKAFQTHVFTLYCNSCVDLSHCSSVQVSQRSRGHRKFIYSISLHALTQTALMLCLVQMPNDYCDQSRLILTLFVESSQSFGCVQY